MQTLKKKITQTHLKQGSSLVRGCAALVKKRKNNRPDEKLQHGRFLCMKKDFVLCFPQPQDLGTTVSHKVTSQQGSPSKYLH